MWITRTLEQRVHELAKQFPAIVLTGARQTGKTSLLRRALPKAKLVPLDLPSTAQHAEENAEDFLRRLSTPVILDEVQYVPGLFRHLKRNIDDNRHAMGRFFLTGSQKFSLMKELSESLAGRAAILELDTLSAPEMQSIPGNRKLDRDVLWRGGFPELYRDPNVDTAIFYSSYVTTYLERDVRSALRVGSLRDFERFLRACAVRSGQLLNLADLARDVGIAGTTARDWISVLEASNQIVLIEPYFGNIGKRMIKTPKLYFRDTGLLCFLLGMESQEALERSASIGAVWETFVLHQLLCAREASAPAAKIFVWRDAQGTEVDFVIEHNGRLRLIEAKWTETIRDLKTISGLMKIKPLLGKKAAAEHWVVCRTAHSHTLAGEPGVNLVNGLSFNKWFQNEA